jgi:asparaginyl-tRNA synthetase
MDKSGFDVRAILAGQAPKDEPVTVKGWVRTRRDSKAGISFVHLSDGSSFHPIQVVAPSTLPNYADDVLRLTAGCAVEATGTIVPSQGKGQSFEMQASAIKVIGWVDDPDTYPIQPKPHTMEFLREVAHLRPRTNVIGAATRVRHTLAKAIHRFFDDNGFFWVNTPIITASDAEGAGALFRVSSLDFANLPRTPQGTVDFARDFFGRESFLTVSGQLNVEAYCLALSKVYTFGPTFRAENSIVLHASERRRRQDGRSHGIALVLGLQINAPLHGKLKLFLCLFQHLDGLAVVHAHEL